MFPLLRLAFRHACHVTGHVTFGTPRRAELAGRT